MSEGTPLPAEITEAGARDIVKRNMVWSVAAGLLPIPLVEIAAITAVEVKLIKELAEYHKVPFRNDLAKSAVASLLASLGSVTLGQIVARGTFRLIPVFGPLLSAASLSAVAAAITYAVGRVFTVHFATGGTLLDFEVEKVRAFFRKEFDAHIKTGGTATNEPLGAHGT